jgi:HlyD family secretion protein
MTRSKRIAGLLLLAILTGAGVWLFFAFKRQPGSLLLTLYGNVDIREVQPAFNDNGRVTAMLVQEGDTVRKGDLIATMDDIPYAADLAQARAQAASLAETLARLKAGSRPEEIEQARANMEALAATLVNTKLNYDRMVALVSTRAISKQQHDEARAVHESTAQQYEAARQTYILAVKGPRKEDIAAAEANLRAAEAAVAAAEKRFAETKLYAPEDGVVENRILEPGDMAAPSTPVYTIALNQPLWVRAYIAETDLGKIRYGMRAEITTDSFPGQIYQGWIGYISPAAEFTPKTVETAVLRTALVYQVRVYVCNSRNQLRLGMPATVKLDLSQPAAEGAEAAQTACGPGNDAKQ